MSSNLVLEIAELERCFLAQFKEETKSEQPSLNKLD